MSEIDNHYATDRGGRDKASEGRRRPEDQGFARDTAGRAARAVSDTRERAADLYEDASEWSRDTFGAASRRASELQRRSAAQLNGGRRTVESFVQDNPVMVGVVGLAAGLLIGALLPGTRRENEYFGRYADEVKDQGKRYAQDVVDQGRNLVEENLGRLSQGRDAGDETDAKR